MARTNAEFGAWVAGLLEVGGRDRVLEVGFGPGAVLRRLSEMVPDGTVAGSDPSPEMIRQARARNAAAIKTGRVVLRQAAAERMPYPDAGFDKALAVNSMQVWPDAGAGLRELRRVLRPGGRLALGFTRHSGQAKEGVLDLLAAAGFADGRLVERDDGFCVLATAPPA